MPSKSVKSLIRIKAERDSTPLEPRKYVRVAPKKTKSREELALYMREWRANNKEKVAAAKRKWRLKNQEHCRLYILHYMRSYREKRK